MKLTLFLLKFFQIFPYIYIINLFIITGRFYLSFIPVLISLPMETESTPYLIDNGLPENFHVVDNPSYKSVPENNPDPREVLLQNHKKNLPYKPINIPINITEFNNKIYACLDKIKELGTENQYKIITKYNVQIKDITNMERYQTVLGFMNSCALLYQDRPTEHALMGGYLDSYSKLMVLKKYNYNISAIENTFTPKELEQHLMTTTKNLLKEYKLSGRLPNILALYPSNIK